MRATSLGLAGVAFLAGTAWYDLVHDDKVIVKEKIRTVQVEVTPTPVPPPQPSPTSTRLVMPEACGRMLPQLQQAIKYLDDSSHAESQLPQVISRAGVHIADRDVPALAADDQKLRDLKDQIDEAHLYSRQVIGDLTDTLAECRQELSK